MTEIAKVTGERWKTLTDAKKEKYAKLAEQDKARHEKEITQLREKGYFINSEGVKSTDIKPEIKDFPKDTVMPKGIKSAYNCYMKKCYETLKKQFPDKKVAEIFSMIAEKFAKLTDAAKKPYEDESKADRTRHENEIDQLRTNGFFVNKDGVKSCDMKKKVSKDNSKKA